MSQIYMSARCSVTQSQLFDQVLESTMIAIHIDRGVFPELKKTWEVQNHKCHNANPGKVNRKILVSFRMLQRIRKMQWMNMKWNYEHQNYCYKLIFKIKPLRSVMLGVLYTSLCSFLIAVLSRNSLGQGDFLQLVWCNPIIWNMQSI